MKRSYLEVLAMSTLLLVSCNSKEEQTKASDPLPVTTEEATLSTDYNAEPYVGVVEEGSSKLVSFTGTGVITEMLVEEGQKVKKGQLIARLDTTQAQNALKQAQYGEEQARHTSTQASTAEEQSQKTQEQAKYSLEQARIAQEQAENSLKLAKATLDEALDAQTRMKTLHDSNSLPEMKWVEVQTKVQQAQASYDIAKKNCETATVSYKQAKVISDQSKLGGETARTASEQATTGIGQAGVTVNMAKKNLADCSIYAPCDGVITKKYIGKGEVALPSQPVVKLIEINAVKVKVNVPEADFGKITEGTNTTITCAALDGQQFNSNKLEKDLAGDAITHTYNINVFLPNTTTSLLPGMVCTVRFTTNESTPQITAPIRSVQQDASGKNFIWTVKDGKAHRQNITIGNTYGNRIVILSGLSQGTRIITEGYQKADEGTPVRFDADKKA